MSYGESDSNRRPTVTSAQGRSCVGNVAVELWATLPQIDRQISVKDLRNYKERNMQLTHWSST